MKNKIKTLNEEISRMKSLFSEERLYGNLVKNTSMLHEQRRPFQSLKRAFTAGLKTIDPKILTDYLNFKIGTFDDLSKHIDEFPNVWKQLVPAAVDLVKVNSFIKSLDYMANTGQLKNVDKDAFIAALKDVPTEGGMRETVVELYSEALGGSKVIEMNPTKIEVEKVGDEILITKTDGTGKVDQYKKNEKGEFENVDPKKREVEPTKPKVDEVVDPKGKSLDELDGKTVVATEENMTAIANEANKVQSEGSNVFIIQEGAHVENINIQNNPKGPIEGTGVNVDKIKEKIDDMPDIEEKTRLQKIWSGTKSAITGPFKAYLKYPYSDYAGLLPFYIMRIVVIPAGLYSAYIGIDAARKGQNPVRAVFDEWANIFAKFMPDAKEVAEEAMKGLNDALERATDNKYNLATAKSNVIKKTISNFEKIASGQHPIINCKNINDKTDSQILSAMSMGVIEEETAEIQQIIINTPGLSDEQITGYKRDSEKVFDGMMSLSGEQGENWKSAIENAKAECIKNQKVEEVNIEVIDNTRNW
tara:strand:+ start:6789 stop:8381 length:1593 start_codon:yes stop_codon:yes gene_type:complete